MNNIEMLSKREELSDSELDGVTAGSLQGMVNASANLFDETVDTVREAVHTVAQWVADKTRK